MALPTARRPAKPGSSRIWPFRTASIDALLLAGLILLTLAIPHLYLSHEQFIYYWDLANYHDQAGALASSLRESPRQAAWLFLISFNQDYNKLFAVALVPIFLAFGASRQAFVIALGLAYLLPFSVLMGAIAKRLIPVHHRAVFWTTAYGTYALPGLWIPALRGYPDVGSAALVALALLIFLLDTRLGQRWQIPAIAIPLGLAVVMRRHYASTVVAFLCALFLQGMVLFFGMVRKDRQAAVRETVRYASRLGLIALGVVICAAPILYLILKQNYAALYASYEEPVLAQVQFFGSHFGWCAWLTLIAGFSAASPVPGFRRPSILWIALFGALALAIWMIFLKETGLPFSTHYLFLLALGQSLCFWSMQLSLAGKLRLAGSAVLIAVLLANFLSQLTTLGAIRYPLRSLFAATYLPMVRNDYDEFTRLLETLRSLYRPGDLIYVVSSSEVLNQDILRQAESQIYGRERAELSVFPSPDIDSRDSYPLEGLLKADLVLVANPFQSVLPAEEQEVVKTTLDIFDENREFAGDFNRLPDRFLLGDGVVVWLYQRARPTSLETALLSLRYFQSEIQPRPGGQSDWLLLDSPGSSWIAKNPDQTVDLGYDGGSPLSAIYFGALPEQMQLTASVQTSKDQFGSCADLSVRLGSLTAIGDEMNHSETIVPASAQSQLSLRLERADAEYLRLDLSTVSKGLETGACPVQFLHLKISAP